MQQGLLDNIMMEHQSVDATLDSLNINYEWYTILNSNYLLIHKNGCSSVRRNFSNTRSLLPNPELMNWTTIRNPIERFKSGLAYDIKSAGYANISKLHDKIENLIYGDHSHLGKAKGNTCHTYMQSLYFLNEKIHMFVRIEDLEDFIRVHHHKHEYFDDGENKNGKEEVEIASKIIDSIDKRRLNDLFYIENQIYDRIVNSSHVWRWQNGNVLSKK